MAVAAQTTTAFAPSATGLAGVKSSMRTFSPLYAEENSEGGAFMPPAEAGEEGEIDLSTVEMLGRGAAKVCVSRIIVAV